MGGYAPDYGGGAAVTTRETCHALSARGHEVRVLTVERRAGAEAYSVHTDTDGPIVVERVNLPYFVETDPEGWQLGIARWRAHEQRLRLLFDGLIAAWRPDAVDYHTVRPFGEECLFSVARHGVPMVATLHEAWLICARLMLLRSPTATACDGPGPARCLECIYSHYDGSHALAAAKLPWRMARLGAYPAYRLRQRARARRHVRGAIARSEFMARVHLSLIHI